jgi:hypothetical protein
VLKYERIPWILFFLCATISVPAAAQDIFQPRAAEAVYTANSMRDTLFVLPLTWVEFDSIRVFRNQTQIAEYSHWRLMDPGNQIWVYAPLGPRDTLKVKYS